MGVARHFCVIFIIDLLSLTIVIVIDIDVDCKTSFTESRLSEQMKNLWKSKVR